jgi:hypothetical protein
VTLAQRYLAKVAALGCCVCRRLGLGRTPAEVHHIAEGSSIRSDFAVAPLCPEHHRGESGFHTLKESRFCQLYDVPWGNEYGLLVWTAEDLERAQR